MRVCAPRRSSASCSGSAFSSVASMPGVVGGRAVHALGGRCHARGRCSRRRRRSRARRPAPGRRRSRRRARPRAPGRCRSSRSPMSASPESLSRTRRNAGRPSRQRSLAPSCCVLTRRARSAANSSTSTPASPSAWPTVFAVSWIQVCSREHDVGEERLLQQALDDLLAHLLGLRLAVRLLRVDLALGSDLVLPEPRRGASSAAPANEMCIAIRRASVGVSAAHAHEHPDLVRRRVDVLGEQLASLGLDARGAADLDVLAELRRPARRRSSSSARDRVRPVDSTASRTLLGEAQELLVLRDGLGLAADRDQDAFACRRPSTARCPRSSRVRRACRRRRCPARAAAAALRRCRLRSPRGRACSPSSPRPSGRGAL